MDCALVDGVYHIRHTTQAAIFGQAPAVRLLTNAAEDDHGPRIAFAPNGDALVVWWRDSAINGVFARRRAGAYGAWLMYGREFMILIPEQPGILVGPFMGGVLGIVQWWILRQEV